MRQANACRLEVGAKRRMRQANACRFELGAKWKAYAGARVRSRAIGLVLEHRYFSILTVLGDRIRRSRVLLLG